MFGQCPKAGNLMETATMPRVPTEATIENLRDLWEAERGLIPPEKVRRLVLTDALVDTGATLLSLPRRYIQQLGLVPTTKKTFICSNGAELEASLYGTVRLTIQDRQCPTDVVEVPDNVPVLVGQIPLEYLDLVVNPREGRLTGNPAHGGKHIIDMY
jgi:predicted aspartyl protease